MKKLAVAASAVITALAVVAVGAAVSQQTNTNRVRAVLTGFEEVPAVSTFARGTFSASIRADSVSYSLTYSGLEAPVAAAHIHLGQPGVAAGVSAFLCGGGNKPVCPASGTVTGTIVATDVVGPAAQGIAPGEFGEFVRALRAGMTYANVHTTKFAGGEIRGQISVVKPKPRPRPRRRP